jgi:hypothetical protein
VTTPRSDHAPAQTVRDDLLLGLRGWQKDAYHEYFRTENRRTLVIFDEIHHAGDALSWGEFGTATAAGSPEEEDFLGLPGLLEPDQVRALLRKRQAAQLAARSRAASAAAPTPAIPASATPKTPSVRTPRAPAISFAPATAAAPPAAPPVSRQALAALRKELNGLVGAWSHRTGQPHGVIHAELRRTCGGPPLPQATADQIRARIDTIRRWAVSGR